MHADAPYSLHLGRQIAILIASSCRICTIWLINHKRRPMTPATTSQRSALIQELTNRFPRVAPGFNEDGIPGPTSQYFGINTLGVRQLRDKLPKEVFASLAASIRHGKKLDLAIAPVVAQVIKEWAISRGVTHFTHCFFLNDTATTEKH